MTAAMSFANIVRRRLILLVFVVFGVSVVTFVISHLIPGDPARLIAGDRASDQTVANIRHGLGLDQPLWRQYVIYVGQLAHGDFGISIRTQRPVIDDILRFFPATIELALAALLFAIFAGIPLGVISAVAKDRWIDQLAAHDLGHRHLDPGLLAGSAAHLPVLWAARDSARLRPHRPGHRAARLDHRLLYRRRADRTATGPPWRSALAHLALPMLTLGFVHLGIVTRQIRSAMLEVLQEDYIRTARASGLSRARVIFDHALRNALIPSVTMIGLAFGDLLYGAVLTETVYAWPGMGNYVVQSITALDFPAIMGFTVVASTAYVLLNLAVDLTYMLLDPQIREIG